MADLSIPIEPLTVTVGQAGHAGLHTEERDYIESLRQNAQAADSTYLPGDATGATDGQVPVWDATAAKFLPGPPPAGGGGVELDASDFGAVGDDATDDTAALAAAVAEAKATLRPLFIPEGTYRITAPLDLRGHGLRVYGAGQDTGTMLKQMTVNTPVYRLGGRHQHITDLGATYAVDPTSAHTSANAFEFYKAYWSSYARLYALKVGRGLHVPPVDYDDGDTTTGNQFFSNSLTDIRVTGYAIDGIKIVGHPGGNTGSVWTNVYISNNASGPRVAPTGRALEVRIADEMVFNQVNIEWVLAANLDPVFIESAGNMVFNGLHFEQVELSMWDAAFMHPSDGARIIVNGLTLSNNQIVAGNNHSLFRYFGNAHVIVNGLYQHDNTVVGTFGLASLGGATAGVASLTANAADLALFTTLGIAEKAAPGQVIRELNGNRYRWQQNGKNHTTGTAAPTAGTWAVGDTVWNTAPAAGGAPGWVCTVAGTPGTWKAMANLAA